MKKRLFSILLSLAMVVTMMPMSTMTVFATGTSYAITNGTPESAKGTNHGYIAIDKTTATEGENVKITVNPATGYQLKSLTVAPTGFVDLGIKDAEGKPLYWKETNLGASNPQDSGDYYMWGTTALMYSAVDRSKTDGAFTIVAENPYGDNYKNTWDETKGFNWNNVPFTNGVFNNTSNRNVFTKYTTIDTYAKSGTPDNITTLQPEDDAATEENENWRMPTKDELAALATNCVLVWTDNYSTGNAGYIVYKAKNDADKGKANIKNGTWNMWDAANSKYIANTGSEPTGYSTSDIHIFLPAAGRGFGNGLGNLNTGGVYFSGTLGSTDDTAYTLTAMSIGISLSLGQRLYGYSIRPVMSDPEITPAKQTDGTYQFTMPGYAVTITAEFEKIPAHAHGTGAETVIFSGAINTFGDLQTLFANGGSGYLANNIDCTAELTVADGKTVNLCLNDKVLDLKKLGNITVAAGTTLNLYDCSEGTTRYYNKDATTGLWTLNTALTSGNCSTTGGIITGGTGILIGNAKHGGGVYVDHGTFNMYGGSITGNTANYGGGVDDNGAFNMYGGAITKNYATQLGGGINLNGTFNMYGGEITDNETNDGKNGGGVYVNSGSFTMSGGKITDNKATGYGAGVYFNYGTVTLGGTAKITGNIKGWMSTSGVLIGDPQNVYLPKGKTVNLGTGTDAPANGMSIGVTTQTAPVDGTPVQITFNGTSTDTGYFASDDTDYEVKFNTNHLELAKHILPLAPESYTVTFNMNGHGTQIDSKTVEEGNKVTKPADPTADGWVFGGWFKEAECTNAWDFDKETVKANMTLYAKWTKVIEPENVSVLLVKGAKSGDKAVKLTWNKVDGATKYVVYGNSCGKDVKKLKTTTGKTYTV